MTKISCGVIIRDNDRMLISRPTNHSAWNIPKGIKNENEPHMEAAFRETKEETGIDFYTNYIKAKNETSIDFDLYDYLDLHSIKVDYLGEFPYYSGKRLVLYDVVFDTEDLPAIEDMMCTSMFFSEDLGILLPEISNFKYIPIEDYDKYVNKSLKKVLDKIF